LTGRTGRVGFPRGAGRSAAGGLEKGSAMHEALNDMVLKEQR